MKKDLNQEEIDALFGAAKAPPQASAPPGATARQRKVEPRDIRRAGQISGEHVRAVSMLHDGFARNLTHNMEAYLRGAFEVNLVSVEQLSYGEFLHRIPEITYVASVNLMPADAFAAMQIDLPLAFPIIDMMLGGPGKIERELREVTEIEEQILESVVRMICRELQNTWQSLQDVEFIFDQRQPSTQTLQLMPPNEKVLALSFEIRMPAQRGMLNFAFPAVVSNALLRRLSKQWSYQRRVSTASAASRLRELVTDCPFRAQLVLPPTSVTVREMLDLEVGSLIMLRQRAEAPALLEVAGKGMFTAYPVRTGSTRGAQIERQLSIAGTPRK